MTRSNIVLIGLALLSMAVAAQAQNWKQSGPDPMAAASDLTTNNSTLSGIVTDIAVDPSGSTDQTIYIATGGGGVWKTTDGGKHWSPKTDFLPELTIGAVTLDPQHSNTVYAGVGGPWYTAQDGGIYRSLDGGDKWTIFNPGNIFNGVTINRMVMPVSGTLIVATSNGLFKSVDGAKHFGNNAPKFDNGNPITINVPKVSGGLTNGNITDLKIDTKSNTTIYAAVADHGLYKSTDQGSSFPAPGKLFSEASFPSILSGSGVNVVFAQSTQPDNQTFYATLAIQRGEFAMLKSTNGGSKWKQVQLGTDVINEYQQAYDQIVGVDPQDANGVYIGQINLYYSSDGAAHGIDANTNGNTPDWIDNQLAHVDQHAIAFSPKSHYGRSPTKVFTGNDGGLVTTAGNSKPGSQWSFLNGDLATNLLYAADFGRGSKTNNSYIYGAFQDTGSAEKSPATGNAWTFECCGDSGYISVDPDNPKHAVSLNDGCYLSTVDGTDWNQSNTCNDNIANFPPKNIPPLQFVIYDPNGGDVMYAAANATLYRSKNGGTSFKAMHSFAQNIQSIGLVKGDSDTVWLGLVDGTVRRTHDASKDSSSSWTKKTIAGAPSNQGVTSIAIDPIHTNTVVVTYPGFTGGDPPAHVFMSKNDGDDWKNIDGTSGGGDNNLPDLPIFSVVIVPSTSPHSIVVGSDAGVLVTQDEGNSWQVLGKGLPNVQVSQLVLDTTQSPPVLRAGTFGRSIFTLEGSCPFCAAPAKCTDTYDNCVGTVSISCTGDNVGIIYNAATCVDAGGEPRPCYQGFNGSTSVSAGWAYGPYGVTGSGFTSGASYSAKVCTGSNNAQTCTIVTPKLVYPNGACPAVPSEPPAKCSQGETYCTKFSPARCVPSNQCTLQKPTP